MCMRARVYVCVSEGRTQETKAPMGAGRPQRGIQARSIAPGVWHVLVRITEGRGKVCELCREITVDPGAVAPNFTPRVSGLDMSRVQLSAHSIISCTLLLVK